jgi:hypothetical protein
MASLASALNRSALLPVLLAFTVLAPAAARAQAANPAEVEELIRQGNELRRAGKDPMAVPVFQKAYDLEPSARTAAQLGLVEAQMGYWVAAEKHLSEALSFTRHPWLDRNRAVVDETLKKVQSYIGELDVTGSPAGAEVVVNGKPVGNLPLDRPVRVAEGPVQVTLRSLGHAPASTTVTVDGGKRAQVTLALKPGVDPGPGATGSTSVLAPGTDYTQPAGSPGADAGTSARGGSPGWVRPAAWAATAGAVLAMSVGTYGLLSQRAAKADFDEFVNPGATMPSCFTSLQDKGGSKCKEYYDRSQSARKLAIGGFAAGGVLAAGAIVGFVLSSGDGGTGGARVTYTFATAGRGGAGGWTLRF